MYNFSDREQFLNSIISFIQSCPFFEGLIQIGSGVIGFSDIYSDTDLMAGCYDFECVKNADNALTDFFKSIGATHIEKRRWTNSAFGISAYFENGLSTDISFMPTEEIPIRSSLYKIIFSKTENFIAVINGRIEKFEQQPKSYGIDDSVHYRFINELRYAEIALFRNNYIFAEIALGNARRFLLSVETAAEGKKTHQFKAYNTLSEDFIKKLKGTYPKDLSFEEMRFAKDKMLVLYLETVKNSDVFNFDDSLLYLINCFE